MNAAAPVTAMTAGVFVILQMTLQFATSMSRMNHKQGLGDGGHKRLEIAIRRHGNLIENAPILLIVLWLMETAGLAHVWLMGFAVTAILGRVSHAIGVSLSPDRPHALRFAGAMSSILLGLAGGVWLIWEASNG